MLMEYIAHRINTIEELRKLSPQYGVELDLRDDLNGNIYISHNPFEPGESFEQYLKQYHHGTMILNVKSERIEHKILEMLQRYNISKYFFLDSSFPMIKLLSDMGEKNVAVRFSEYEGIDTLENMAGKIQWVWVDTFSCLPLDKKIFTHIKELGYKVCLVSPELQGQPEKLEEYAKQIVREDIKFDAICSKIYMIEEWKKAFNQSK